MVGSLLLLATPMMAPAPKFCPPRDCWPPRVALAALEPAMPTVPGLFPVELLPAPEEPVSPVAPCEVELPRVDPPAPCCCPMPEGDCCCEKIPFWFTGCVLALPKPEVPNP